MSDKPAISTPQYTVVEGWPFALRWRGGPWTRSAFWPAVPARKASAALMAMLAKKASVASRARWVWPGAMVSTARTASVDRRARPECSQWCENGCPAPSITRVP
jgi:hypothetical protein